LHAAYARGKAEKMLEIKAPDRRRQEGFGAVAARP
jgi:hypothetical protein